jgi:protein SFI1
VDLTRPSPRKEIYRDRKRSNQQQRERGEERDRSRSLVGYTPSQSLDYDLLSIHAPVRTSTPVFAQDHGHRHGHGQTHSRAHTRTQTQTHAQSLMDEYDDTSPPLPPYTESDISISVTSTPSTSATIDDLAPPAITNREQGSTHSRHHDHDRQQYGDGTRTPRARSAVLIQDDLVDKVILAEMERRAIEFYETGLRGRCFDVWAQAHEWIQASRVFVTLSPAGLVHLFRHPYL